MNRRVLTSAFAMTVFAAATALAGTGAPRVDLDLKYRTETAAEFYRLSHFLDGRPAVTLDGKEYGVRKSLNEFFVDQYFDTPAFYLFKKDSGLRLRSRYYNGQLAKRLVQFKIPARGKGKAKVELKIELDGKTVFNDVQDLVRTLLLPQYRDNPLVRAVQTVVDPAGLRLAVVQQQIRTRYYFQDEKGVPYFTITFDEVYVQKGLGHVPYQEIEFEINEKQMGMADAQQAQKLIDAINVLVEEAQSTRIRLIPVEESKYGRALAAVGITPRRSGNGSGMAVSVMILLAATAAGYIFWKRKGKFRSDKQSAV